MFPQNPFPPAIFWSWSDRPIFPFAAWRRVRIHRLAWADGVNSELVDGLEHFLLWFPALLTASLSHGGFSVERAIFESILVVCIFTSTMDVAVLASVAGKSAKVLELSWGFFPPGFRFFSQPLESFPRLLILCAMAANSRVHEVRC